MKRIVITALHFLLFVPMLSAQSNYALTFNAGTNTYVRVLHTDTLAPESAITLEAWINAVTLSGSPSIISKTEVGGYALYGAGGFLRFDVRLNGFYQTVSTDGAELIGAWHHVACTSDGKYTRLYVDGVLKHSTDAGAFYPIQYQYDNALIIGGEAGGGISPGGSFFSGSVDEVRIWNTARTHGEINAAMNISLTGNESGLVGYWNFDEGSGTSANDLSIFNQDGTLFNSPAWSSSGATLPVELVSFTATAKRLTAELTWKTATEVNNHGFEVERKEIRGPGFEENSQITDPKIQNSNQNWEKIGVVEGNGTTNSAHEYSFTDHSLSAGQYLYRLKQIDREGTFSFSQEVEVFVGNVPAVLALEQNYPNPFNPATYFTYHLPAANRTVLTVYDILGREVRTAVNAFQNAGSYTVQFDGTGLVSGTYFIRLQSGPEVQIRTMMLLK